MKTPDEIKKGLENAFTIYNSASSYFVSETLQKVTAKIAKESLSYIQQLETKCHQLERERDALAALYKPHGTCGSCKHNESKICDNCINKDNRWEWAGIKEDNP